MQFECRLVCNHLHRRQGMLFRYAAETHSRASSQLSDFGKTVTDKWLKSFEIRHELLLDE